jgi:hypothetical protein
MQEEFPWEAAFERTRERSTLEPPGEGFFFCPRGVLLLHHGSVHVSGHHL